MFEFGQVVGQICCRRLISPGVLEVELSQAIDNERGMGWFVNNREKLEERLFEWRQFLVLFEQRCWDGHIELINIFVAGASLSADTNFPAQGGNRNSNYIIVRL